MSNEQQPTKRYRLLRDIFDADKGTILTQLCKEYEEMYEYETIIKGKFKRTHKHFVEGNAAWFEEVKPEIIKINLIHANPIAEATEIQVRPYDYHFFTSKPIDREKVKQAIESILNNDTDTKDNQIYLLKDDLWCVHKFLDDLNIPRHDSKQKDYSIVGRIKLLRIQHLQELSKLESEILLNRLPPNDTDTNQSKGERIVTVETKGFGRIKILFDAVNGSMYEYPVKELEQLLFADMHPESKPTTPTSNADTKGWEILSFVRTNGSSTIWELCDGRYKNSIGSSWELEEMLNDKDCSVKAGNLKIHSVKRLSDNQVFSIGDKLCNMEDDDIIVSIKQHTHNDLWLCTEEKNNYGIVLSMAEKSKPEQPKEKDVLFTTEDGVEIRENDKYWKVHGLTNISACVGADYTLYKNMYKDERPDSKRFSTREKAEQYILENKPCLSLDDVTTFLHKEFVFDSIDFFKLKEITQQKLSQP